MDGVDGVGQDRKDDKVAESRWVPHKIGHFGNQWEGFNSLVPYGRDDDDVFDVYNDLTKHLKVFNITTDVAY